MRVQLAQCVSTGTDDKEGVKLVQGVCGSSSVAHLSASLGLFGVLT